MSHARPTVLAVCAWVVVAWTTACASVPFPSTPPRSGPRAEEPAWSRPTGLYYAVVGSRAMDDEVAWDEIDRPFTLGFEGGPLSEGPIGYELGLSFSRDRTDVLGVDVSSNFLEFSIGGRAVAGEGPLFPYAGAGLSMILAEADGQAGGFSVSDDDLGFGVYAHAGLLYRVGAGFFLGLDGRLVRGADVRIFGLDTDADYVQVAATIGWSD